MSKMKKFHTVDVLYDKKGQDYHWRTDSIFAESKEDAAKAVAHTARRKFKVIGRIDARVIEDGRPYNELKLIKNVQ